MTLIRHNIFGSAYIRQKGIIEIERCKYSKKGTEKKLRWK